MKRLSPLGLVLALALAGCTEPVVKPQVAAPASPPPAGEAQPAVIKHNLSRVAEAKPVAASVLEGFTLGKTTRAEVAAALGDAKPFSLGDGKSILRYDVGKFIFDQNGVLLRKFLSP